MVTMETSIKPLYSYSFDTSTRHFWNLQTLRILKMYGGICPSRWYQSVYFWLLAHGLLATSTPCKKRALETDSPYSSLECVELSSVSDSNSEGALEFGVSDSCSDAIAIEEPLPAEQCSNDSPGPVAGKSKGNGHFMKTIKFLILDMFRHNVCHLQ